MGLNNNGFSEKISRFFEIYLRYRKFIAQTASVTVILHRQGNFGLNPLKYRRSTFQYICRLFILQAAEQDAVKILVKKWRKMQKACNILLEILQWSNSQILCTAKNQTNARLERIISNTHSATVTVLDKSGPKMCAHIYGKRQWYTCIHSVDVIKKLICSAVIIFLHLRPSNYVAIFYYILAMHLAEYHV